MLAKITAPVLLLYGSETALRWFVDSVHHVARHVGDSRVREVPEVGHAGPTLGSGLVADELIAFFASRHAAV